MNKARTQAASPPESEEDRLIRMGWALATGLDEATPDKTDLGTLSPDDRQRYLELGKKDPRPFMERLKQLCRKLLEPRPEPGREAGR